MKNRFQQLFKPAGASAAAYGLRVQNEGQEATIYVYDAIGAWFGGVEALAFAAQLAQISASLIHLRVNSPGGDVFEARAMQTALKQHPAQVIAHVDGVAASAASFLVMGADQVEMAQGAFLMIHNAMTFTVGDKAEMYKIGDFLSKMDVAISADYQAKTGKDAAQIAAWMDAETWFSAQESLDSGFADSIYEPSQAEGQGAQNRFDLGVYNNVPQALRGPAGGVQQTDPVYDREQIERRLALIEQLGRRG